jgi:ubiquitin-conjugating enzyme E2 variant
MHSALLIALQALGVVLLADFVAGLVHWLEDAYGSEDTPLVGPLLIKPNIVHHHHPRFFTKLSWWQSSWDLLLVGAAILGVAASLDALTWQVGLFAIISVNANQIHKWSHMSRAEVGPVVAFLQDCRILLTPRQHALHHTDPKNTYYCPVTNLMNPVLEAIRFWDRLEAVIERLTGVGHRHDTSNRGRGPGPGWLADYRPVRAGRAPAVRDDV